MYQRLKGYIKFEESDGDTKSIHYLMLPKQRFVNVINLIIIYLFNLIQPYYLQLLF